MDRARKISQALLGADGKPLAGLGTSLCYRGEATALFYSSSRWFSRDRGQSWKESVQLEPAMDGKPWYTWEAPLIERDPRNGKITRLTETGYAWFKPPEVKTAHQQAYLRFSADGGKHWSQSFKAPQWEAVSEVALLRRLVLTVCGAPVAKGVASDPNCLCCAPLPGYLRLVPGGGKCRSRLMSRVVVWTEPKRL